MKSLIELLRESVVTQLAIALLTVGGSIVMLLSGHAVPDWLIVSSSTVIGFYYGAKSDNAQRVAMQNLVNTLIGNVTPKDKPQ